MNKCVPIKRHPMGPTENAPSGSWLDRRNRVRKAGLGGELELNEKGRVTSEKEGELVEVCARIEKIVHKPDLEIVLAFVVEETCGTVEMFANLEIYDYDKKKEAEVFLHGEKIPVGDLDRFILRDTLVMALVYWRSSRVVTTGKRWKVAKLWKTDPCSQFDSYSVTSWDFSLPLQMSPEKSSEIRRSRSCHRKTLTSPSKKNWRSSSEPPKNSPTEKKGDSYQDKNVSGETFSWETLLKRRICCNVKSVNMRLPNLSNPEQVSISTSLPSSPTFGPGPSLPLCLFAVPAIISEVKKGEDGIEFALTFDRMSENHEALMIKKYLSALMLDGVTETWRNVHEMLVPGLEVAIDVKNILFNKERKWLVFGLYLGQLKKSDSAHFIESNASRKEKMKMKEEAWKNGITTIEKIVDQEEMASQARYNEEIEIPKTLVYQLQDELNQLRKQTHSQGLDVIQDNAQLNINNEYHAVTLDDKEQLDFGASLMNDHDLDATLSDNEGDPQEECDHQFDFSGAISHIESTTFTLLGPFADKWIKAKLNASTTNIYKDGVRINDPSEIASFLKKSKGAMGNLVLSKCLKCSDFKMSDEGDLIVDEALLAWFGVDNAPWIQGDFGKVTVFSSANEQKESLAVISLSNSSSKVWYNMSQHTGPPLSIGSGVLVWAFRECTEAYYIGAAVVAVPDKTYSENPKQQNNSNEQNECSFVNPLVTSQIGAEIEENYNTALSDGSASSSTGSFIINERKIMSNPSEGSFSSIISPLSLENCSRYSANAADMFSFSPSTHNLYALNVSNFEKEETELDRSLSLRRPPRSLPSPTDSEYSEADYRGTFAQIDALKRRDSTEKKVELSDLLKTEAKNELTMIGYADSIHETDKTDDDEVFSPILISSNSDFKISNHATRGVDENRKAVMNKLMLKDDKITKQLKSCDDFYKVAKIESSFEALVKDNNTMNLVNPVIDTQFEMILYINQLDSNLLINSQAEMFDECYGSDDWTRTDPVKRVGRFTVFGEDNPEVKDTSLLDFNGPTEGYLEKIVKEMAMPNQNVEKLKPASTKVLPPIPEETETCSEAASEDHDSDGLENSMSWTYIKKTPSPTKLIRFTSTPHLNKDEGMLERGFTSDSSHDLTKSFTARDSDSGFGESKDRNAPKGDSLDSTGDKEKRAKLPLLEELDDTGPNFSKKSPPESSLQNIELLVKKNLVEFLSFTDFPEEHRNALVEKFMDSGKALL